MECPICGKEMRRRSWADDIGGATMTVETLHECPDGHYADHYSYGQTEVTVCGRQFGWDGFEADEEIAAVQAEIDAAVAAVKADTRPREWPALAPPPAPAPAAAPPPDAKTAEARAFDAAEIERSIRHGGRVML